MFNDGPAKADEALGGLNFLGGLQEALASAVVVVDDQKRLCGFNPEAEKLLRLPASKVLRQSIDVLPFPLREAIEKTFLASSPQDSELTIPAGDNPELVLQVSTSFAQMGQAASLGVVAVIRNLTSAKSLELHLRHLDRLASIGTLSASMAHEIKNALVAVRTFLDLLLAQNKDAELANIVSREVRRIDSIVSQMLRFAGPAKPTFAALRLHDVLEQSFRLIEHQLAGKKIRLKKSLLASPDWVKGDSYQLEQALLNLLFNAIEAMGLNAELFISTELVVSETPTLHPLATPHPTHLRLRIQDSGVGIPPENIPRLFDPFFTTKKKGTGLGLSITRRIIQEHGGSIDVQSALNEGTTFTILLPCAAKPQPMTP